MRTKKHVDEVNNGTEEKLEWLSDVMLFTLIKNGYNLTEIVAKYDINFENLVQIIDNNPHLYEEAKRYYYMYLADLIEVKTKNATTSIVTSYISLLKILKPQIYKNDDLDTSTDIEFELQ